MGVVIDEVIDISVCIGKMVSPVVCNSSPEGFILPVLDQTVQDCNTQHNDKVINPSTCIRGRVTVVGALVSVCPCVCVTDGFTLNGWYWKCKGARHLKFH